MKRRMWVSGGGYMVRDFYRFARRSLNAPRAAARLMTAGYSMGIRAERDRIARGTSPGRVEIRTYGVNGTEWKP